MATPSRRAKRFLRPRGASAGAAPGFGSISTSLKPIVSCVSVVSDPMRGSPTPREPHALSLRFIRTSSPVHSRIPLYSTQDGSSSSQSVAQSSLFSRPPSSLRLHLMTTGWSVQARGRRAAVCNVWTGVGRICDIFRRSRRSASAQGLTSHRTVGQTTPCSASRTPRFRSTSTRGSSAWSLVSFRRSGAASADEVASLTFSLFIAVHESPGGDFTNYFLAFPEEGKENLSKEEKSERKFQREGILELCHNVSARANSSSSPR